MDKVSYSLGLSLGNNLVSSGIKDLNVEDFVRGLTCVLESAEPEITYEEAEEELKSYFTRQQEEQFHNNKAAGQTYLAENGAREGVVTLPSGVQYEVLVEGNGPKPSPTDTVRCHYEGSRTDGQIFDSSIRRGEPATFPVNGVIKGWQEVLPMMPVGSKWRVVIPEEHAYGSHGAGQLIEPYMALIFEIELLGIEGK